MAVIFSDDFSGHGAGNPQIDASPDWDQNGGVAGVTVLTAAETVDLVTDGTSANGAKTTTNAHAAIADCEAQMEQIENNAGFDWFVAGRITKWTTADLMTLYHANVYGTTLEVYRHNNSTSGTLIGSGVAITRGTNKILKLKLEGTGATVTLTANYDGTENAVTDSSGSRLTAAGQTGFGRWDAGAARQLDNFSVDDLTTPPSGPNEEDAPPAYAQSLGNAQNPMACRFLRVDNHLTFNRVGSGPFAISVIYREKPN